jgi:hypothetical protein
MVLGVRIFSYLCSLVKVKIVFAAEIQVNVYVIDLS